MHLISLLSRPRWISLSLILLVVLSLAFEMPAGTHAEPDGNGTSQALPVSAPYRYYEETGHNIGGAFLHFYDTHGGIEAFGLPLTEAITVTEVITGIPVELTIQYFERARLELQAGMPPASAVRMSQLGSMLTAGRQEVAFTQQPLEISIPGTALFPIASNPLISRTSFSLRGQFGIFWKEQGGLERFGYPISEPLLEEIDGALRLVQYFERARLEYHPAQENQASTIRIGLMGRDYLKLHPLPGDLMARAPAMVMLADATTPYYGEDSSDGHNVILGAQRIDRVVVPPGAVMSFLDAVGPITAAAGFRDGYGIVNKQIVPMIGGGICQVSSALYAAALEAGLEIIERHNHSYLLSFFADRPGVEAAVYTDGQYNQDLRWRNSTAYPVEVVVTFDRTAKLVHVALWGAADGHTTTVSSSIIEEYRAEETWVLDEEMEDGTFEEQVKGSPGMDVLVVRQVRAADGQIVREDRIVTSYAALGAVFHHGPGGNPNETTTPTPTATPEPTPAEATPEPALEATPEPVLEEPTLEPVLEEPAPEPTATWSPPVQGVPAAEPGQDPSLVPTQQQPGQGQPEAGSGGVEAPAEPLPTEPPAEPPPTEPPAEPLPTPEPLPAEPVAPIQP